MDDTFDDAAGAAAVAAAAAAGAVVAACGAVEDPLSDCSVPVLLALVGSAKVDILLLGSAVPLLLLLLVRDAHGLQPFLG